MRAIVPVGGCVRAIVPVGGCARALVVRRTNRARGRRSSRAATEEGGHIERRSTRQEAYSLCFTKERDIASIFKAVELHTLKLQIDNNWEILICFDTCTRRYVLYK